ncbi:MAG: cation-transporting P-type ATPase [Acidobacteriota bacterium]|nr:cation-transporting P-type ATPase [Acidobacteriota bacterium]MDQ2980361.1 cation-transporting P-type ATPase [Acidobacteriota bacterium]
MAGIRSPAIAGGAAHPGLTEDEARGRLAAEGFNELPGRRRRGLATIAFEIVREPMILLLLAASSVYLVLGNPREAVVLLASIVVVIAISLYQNQKTERALDALRDLASPRALVIREGRSRRVPGREVVPGDVVDGQRSGRHVRHLMRTNGFLAQARCTRVPRSGGIE